MKEAALEPPPASRSIIKGITAKDSDKDIAGSPQGIARSPEESIAAAELERCYDESTTTRAALIHWQETLPASGEVVPHRTALAALLDLPWDRNKDAPALFDRCFTSLTRKGDGNVAFGSPERCRAMVWRYLTEFRNEWHEVFTNPERWDQLEAIRQSGNPWGVDQKLVAALVEEAITSLRSEDSAEREAADTFLNAHWITDHHLSDERCWFLLDQGIPGVRKAGVAALARRGKGQQAAHWLMARRDLPVAETATLLRASIVDFRTLPDWELPVVLRLLEISPLEAADLLARKSRWIKRAGGEQFPAEIQSVLRRFLEKEADSQSFVGTPVLKPGEQFQLGAHPPDPRDLEPDRLSSALCLLASWGNPDDTPLLKKYLTHPAGFHCDSNGKFYRFYGIRSTAAQLLKERNESVPDDTVFKGPLD